MAKAIWNGVTIAESDQCEIVEGNYYFPPNAIIRSYFQPSHYQTTCAWKGTAHYYHVTVNGKVNENAAWFYPQPKSAAKNIENYVAFWHGIEILT